MATATKPKSAAPKTKAPAKPAVPKLTTGTARKATQPTARSSAKATPKPTARSAAKAAPKPAAKKAAASPARRPAARKTKESNHIDRVWHLAKRIGVCMFVTWDGERQRARPLAARVKRDEHAIYFLADVHGRKDDQIEKFPVVTLAFSDNSGAKYVSITGKASISNDRAKIKALWSPFAKAWWPSAADPSIRVIKVEPQDAELWDNPGRIATTVAMLAAAVTGRQPTIGENAKVAL